MRKCRFGYFLLYLLSFLTPAICYSFDPTPLRQQAIFLQENMLNVQKNDEKLAAKAVEIQQHNRDIRNINNPKKMPQEVYDALQRIEAKKHNNLNKCFKDYTLKKLYNNFRIHCELSELLDVCGKSLQQSKAYYEKYNTMFKEASSKSDSITQLKILRNNIFNSLETLRTLYMSCDDKINNSLNKPACLNAYRKTFNPSNNDNKVIAKYCNIDIISLDVEDFIEDMTSESGAEAEIKRLAKHHVNSRTSVIGLIEIVLNDINPTIAAQEGKTNSQPRIPAQDGE